MTADRRSYSAGHFELAIDGHTSTAYLKSVEGGFVKGALVEEPIGPDNKRIKHLGTVDIEPMSIEFSLAGAKDILKWIADSWNMEWNRRSGQLTHANFDLKTTFEHQFYEALIAETTFPTLDGSSKDAAYLKLKIQPESVVTSKSSSGSSLKSAMGEKHQTWAPSAFRFTIDGVDDMHYANKIDGFTIKQGIKKHYSGEERFPQIEPTKIEFPNITGTIALEYAGGVLKWYEDYIMRGKKDPTQQKTGAIEFLTPDRKTTIFRINLKEVGILHASIEPSKANAESIKRVKFEMYVGHMELAGPQSGFES